MAETILLQTLSINGLSTRDVARTPPSRNGDALRRGDAEAKFVESKSAEAMLSEY